METLTGKKPQNEQATNQEKAFEMEVTGVEEVKEAKEVKKQKVSISYTLKSFSNNIKKLEDEKIISKEDALILKGINTKAVQHWIGLEFNY